MKTLINFILDKSGSMSMRTDATISGFNEYLKTVKKETKKDKTKASFSLTMFDTEIVKPYVAVDIDKVEDLNNKTYEPNGMTALYDAVCQTIKVTEKKVKEIKEKVAVITVILTDGEENSSQEYTEKNLTAEIKRLQKGNWSFVFLGANQDSWNTATGWGIKTGNIANFSMDTDKSVRSAFNSVALGTSMSMSNFASVCSGGGGGAGTLQEDNFFHGKTDASE